MKKNLMLILVLFCFSAAGIAQTEKIINTTNMLCTEITTNLSKYEVKPLKFKDADADVSLKFFKDPVTKAVVKIEAENREDKAIQNEEFFLVDGKLVLLIVNRMEYDNPIYTRNFQLIYDETESFYFDKEKMIQWIMPNRKNHEEDMNFKKKEKLFLEKFTLFMSKS